MNADKLTQCLRVSNGLEAILCHSRELMTCLNNRCKILELAHWQGVNADTSLLDEFIEKMFDSICGKFKTLTGVDLADPVSTN